jgi:hypothetical protein
MRFRKGDRVQRVGPHVIGTRDWGDSECAVGFLGTVLNPSCWPLSGARIVMVRWDDEVPYFHRRVSAIDARSLALVDLPMRRRLQQAREARAVSQ